jgi:hypothetical protein
VDKISQIQRGWSSEPTCTGSTLHHSPVIVVSSLAIFILNNL